MTHMRKPPGAIVLCLVLWTAGASLSLAQIKSSTIVGSVTDKSGAFVPDANVSISNEDTKVLTPAKTDSAGQYAVPYLEAGRYTIRIEKQGFVAFVETGVSVGVAEQARVDAVLAVGSSTTTVEVVGTLAKLQTETTTFADSVNTRAIENIPNVNSNPFYYATLQPGVVASNEVADTSGPNSFGIGVNARIAFSTININGGQDLENRISIDGINVMSSGNNESAVIPNSEGIEEVRTITNNYSAEYGRGTGVIDIETKGGTNNFHGSVFDRLRNEALNANSFGNNQQGIAKAPFKVNTFGGSIGGPIKKDKAFFFASYQGLIHNTAADWLETVPTANEKAGNFSADLINYNGTPVSPQIYNPFSVTQIGPNLYQRALIPNATIPNPDKFGATVFNYYPAPNRTPIDVYNDQNYFFRGTQTFRGDVVNARLDFYHGKHSIYGSGGIEYGSITTPTPWGPSNPFYIGPTGNGFLPPIQTDKNPYAAIGDTISLSPTLVADIRFGVQRINTVFNTKSYPSFDYSAVGVPANVQAIMPSHELTPDVLVTRYSNLGETLSQHKHERQTNTDLEASLTKVLGKWTLKNGIEFLDDFAGFQDFEEGSARLDTAGSGWCGGCGSSFTSEFITANGGNTAQDTTPAISGFDAADLLLGTGSYYIVAGRSFLPSNNAKYLGLYTQNDWHPTSHLTVNLGLRWDLQPGPTERFNRISSMDVTKMNPFGSAGVYAFPGTSGYSRNLWDTHYNNFGPRLGAAYRLRDNMVVRGGYGITYVPMNTGYFDGTYNYGSQSFGSFTGELEYGTTPAGVAACTFHDASCSPVLMGVGSNTAAPQLYGTGPNIFPRNFLNGRIQQWNVFVEKSLHSEWLISLGYTGTHGDNLMVARWPYTAIGQLSPAITSCYRNGTGCPVNDAAVSGKGYVQTGSDPAFDPVPNPFNPTGALPFAGSLATSTVPRYLLDSAYPMFPGQSGGRSFGWSNYDALTAEIKHNFSHGLQLDSFFTWSKALGLTSTEAEYNADDGGANAVYGNLQNIRDNYTLSPTDFPARFVAVVVYELPFGSGKKFDAQGKALRYVISGWKVGAVQLTQSGFPLPISGANSGALDSRPMRVAGEPIRVPQALQHWYDGKTKVTLPDGRTITPCANCFLRYNPDAFAGSVIANPNNTGQYVADNYWFGGAALAYGGLRSWGRNNLDTSIMRDFRITERVVCELRANFNNFLNHPQFMNFSGGLGATTVVADPATGTKVGQPSNSSSYGTLGNSTYSPRQTEFQLTIRF